jgi:hypothetical protein
MLAMVRAFLTGQSLVAGGVFAGAPGQLSRDALEARVLALSTQLKVLREGFAREPRAPRKRRPPPLPRCRRGRRRAR